MSAAASHHRRPFLPLLAASALAVLAGSASAINIRLTDRNADFFDGGTDPCPRGDINDDCLVASYLARGRDAGRNSTDKTFQRAWNAWNLTLPAGERWNLVQGRALKGTLDITQFDTFNGCPGASGVELSASYTRQPGDPLRWTWIQALWTNWEPVGNRPHDSRPMAPHYMLDIRTKAAPDTVPAPAYPYQYPDGHFYDAPAVRDVHSASLNFDAIALMASINYQTRTVTAYEGFGYGFTVNCTHAPAPGVLGVAASVGLFAARRRRRG